VVEVAVEFLALEWMINFLSVIKVYKKINKILNFLKKILLYKILLLYIIKF
jgi:hypothetical protein